MSGKARKQKKTGTGRSLPFWRGVLSYIGYRKTLFLFCLLSNVLVIGFWALNGASGEDIRYSVLLGALAFLLVVGLDLFAMLRRLRALLEVKAHLNEFEQELPEGGNRVERLYCEIADGYLARAQTEKEELSMSHRATISYFTLWMHQIKTPIAAMRLLMESPELDRTLINRQLFEVERYAELAMQYVRSADIAADLVLMPCELEPLVRESIRKYAPLFIAKGLTAEVGELSLTLLTDAKWFAFVLEQLLSNAVKYTQRGGVRMYVEDNALVLEDTGCGIRPEDMPRVFEKGYTGRNGRIDKRASGIGLFLARRVSDALGVKLELVSVWGKGTKAVMRFPRQEREIFS
ncbi:MAG TPA: sensor histidine kinase [Feifaniaceae bacterium]|nr:sensor histidine kinase [Feifaniaceae bacterium]